MAEVPDRRVRRHDAGLRLEFEAPLDGEVVGGRPGRPEELLAFVAEEGHVIHEAGVAPDAASSLDVVVDAAEKHVGEVLAGEVAHGDTSAVTRGTVEVEVAEHTRVSVNGQAAL